MRDDEKWRGEKREAKRDGATLVPNSGRGALKGDAVLGRFLIDYKHYTGSFSITMKNWKKHAKDAWNSNRRHPLIKVVLNDDTELAIVDWHMFKDMLDFYDENGGVY